MLGNLHQLKKVLTRNRVLEDLNANFINVGIVFQRWFSPKADQNSKYLKKYEKNDSGNNIVMVIKLRIVSIKNVCI